MALKHFIVCMRDTHMRLIGPFETQDAASEWACTPGTYGDGANVPATNNPKDDPRWQTIEPAAGQRGQPDPHAVAHHEPGGHS